RAARARLRVLQRQPACVLEAKRCDPARVRIGAHDARAELRRRAGCARRLRPADEPRGRAPQGGAGARRARLAAAGGRRAAEGVARPGAPASGTHRIALTLQSNSPALAPRGELLYTATAPPPRIPSEVTCSPLTPREQTSRAGGELCVRSPPSIAAPATRPSGSRRIATSISIGLPRAPRCERDATGRWWHRSTDVPAEPGGGSIVPESSRP